MDRLILSDYGNIISDQETGDKIFRLICKVLKEQNNIKVDFDKIKSMATFNAKQIFGKLYIDLGADNFFNRITILNASDDLKLIISLGIQSAIEDNS